MYPFSSFSDNRVRRVLIDATSASTVGNCNSNIARLSPGCTPRVLNGDVINALSCFSVADSKNAVINVCTTSCPWYNPAGVHHEGCSVSLDANWNRSNCNSSLQLIGGVWYHNYVAWDICSDFTSFVLASAVKTFVPVLWFILEPILNNIVKS